MTGEVIAAITIRSSEGARFIARPIEMYVIRHLGAEVLRCHVCSAQLSDMDAHDHVDTLRATTATTAGEWHSWVAAGRRALLTAAGGQTLSAHLCIAGFELSKELRRG